MPDTPQFDVTVITVSDRRAAGAAEDTTGPMIAAAMSEWAASVASVVVPDGIESVRRAISAAVEAGSDVVITTGGTGVSPRDVTPEATAPLLAQLLDGIPELIRREGHSHSPYAALSRGLAGVTAAPERAVVVNLPGSVGGARDGMTVLVPLLPHLVAQVRGSDHQ
ncbi:MogA/MoaB family molybdenum cofactor biosynthesis protein [Demequina globuliformis]|uniref:MogA/MoaB family molybdenum cofactor biosynthesis protein n=1 Tax=Demequina globuliformis TaxID=676202 RepID=UPI000782B17C|nr:MogA/MoaB family molybdenum cofactor biosynthesis protein [Demequina globuliformis]